ncbi:HD domain-containing protein [Holdemanella porci]|nr:HD domain-containing protein [Holdemanella porci]
MAHSYRVVNIGKEFAEKEGLNVEDLMIACLLHDVSDFEC